MDLSTQAEYTPGCVEHSIPKLWEGPKHPKNAHHGVVTLDPLAARRLCNHLASQSVHAMGHSSCSDAIECGYGVRKYLLRFFEPHRARSYRLTQHECGRVVHLPQVMSVALGAGGWGIDAL